jgi:hypothetical protein
VVRPAGEVGERRGRGAVELPTQPERLLAHQIGQLVDRGDLDAGRGERGEPDLLGGSALPVRQWEELAGLPDAVGGLVL